MLQHCAAATHARPLEFGVRSGLLTLFYTNILFINRNKGVAAREQVKAES